MEAPVPECIPDGNDPAEDAHERREPDDGYAEEPEGPGGHQYPRGEERGEWHRRRGGQVVGVRLAGACQDLRVLVSSPDDGDERQASEADRPDQARREEGVGQREERQAGEERVTRDALDTARRADPPGKEV